MLQTVEGIDHSGAIELTQQPQNVSDGCDRSALGDGLRG